MRAGELLRLTYNRDSVILKLKDIIGNYKMSDGYFDEGGFSINGKRIVIQGFRYIPVTWINYTFESEVINDTTIFINSCKSSNNYNYCFDKTLLHFNAVQIPDSLKENRWKNKMVLETSLILSIFYYCIYVYVKSLSTCS